MIVNPLPMQAGAMGALAGAAMGGGAEHPVHSIINAGVGFLVGAVGGGIAARRDAKIARQENPELRNKTQMSKATMPPKSNQKEELNMFENPFSESPFRDDFYERGGPGYKDGYRN